MEITFKYFDSPEVYQPSRTTELNTRSNKKKLDHDLIAKFNPNGFVLSTSKGNFDFMLKKAHTTWFHRLNQWIKNEPVNKTCKLDGYKLIKTKRHSLQVHVREITKDNYLVCIFKENTPISSTRIVDGFFQISSIQKGLLWIRSISDKVAF